MKPQTFYTNSPEDRARLVSFVERIPMDKPLVWKVEEKKKRRSLSQNNLYHKWAAIIADDTGNDPDDMKTILKRKFLTPRLVEFNGEIEEVYSTKGLSTEEMSKFMKRIEAFSVGELGILLPIPEELHMRSVG